MKRLIFLACLTAIAGCANNVWVHPSKNNAQFNQDKNDCVVQAGNAIPREIVPQQSSPPPSYTTNCYGAPGTATCTTTPQVQPNYTAMMQSIADGNTNRARENFFSNCMQSRGWTLHSAESFATMRAQNNDRVAQYEAAMQSIGHEVQQICSSQEYSSYFAKTSCKASELSLSQLSDPSKATKREKEAISGVDVVLVKITKERAEASRKFMYPTDLASDVSALETKVGESFQKLRLDLYNSKITWGQFNTGRKNLSIRADDEYKAILKKYNN